MEHNDNIPTFLKPYYIGCRQRVVRDDHYLSLCLSLEIVCEYFHGIYPVLVRQRRFIALCPQDQSLLSTVMDQSKLHNTRYHSYSQGDRGQN